jgi:hypothetical protein
VREQGICPCIDLHGRHCSSEREVLIQGAAAASMSVSSTQNRFIVTPRERGDNPFDADYIRNSISLTMAASRRIICASNSMARDRRNEA